MKRNYFFILLMALTFLPGANKIYGQEEFKEWNDTLMISQEEFNGLPDSSLKSTLEDTKHATTTTKGLGSVAGLEETKKNPASDDGHKHDPVNLFWVLGIMASAVAAGFLSRSAKGRQLRLFFLIASVAIIGFYRSACPCPISGFQEVLLFSIGGPLHPVRLLWFALLLPITYLFGKVWCGWICHLGALQELVNFNGRFNFLSSPRAQIIMRYSRIILLIVLIMQLIISRTILWEDIDPFKAIFNLFASHNFTWILVALLIISSVLIYRPFCKTVCPVGLVLGWISRIPGASIIAASPNCVGCKLCDHACRSNAITKIGPIVTYDKENCISCGDCIDSCKHKALEFGKNRNVASAETLNAKS